MKTCETCGNKYDKCLEIIKNQQSHFLIASNVLFKRWHQSASIVTAASLDMGWRQRMSFIAATIVRNQAE